jgi:nucleoside-diphosphate-sugar epimerase
LPLIKAMLDGTMRVAPRQRVGVADVRDVADLHIRAMATPEAAGKRYLALADGPTISFLEMALILRERLGALAERVPTEEAPGEEPARLIIHKRPRQAGARLATAARRNHDRGDRREPARSRTSGPSPIADPAGTRHLCVTSSAT